MYLQEIGWSVDWINLAQDWERWWALVIWQKTLGFHKMGGIS
jgi:hypothetical protein